MEWSSAGLADDCKQAAAVPFGCSTPFCLLLAAVWMMVPALLLRLSLSGHGQRVREPLVSLRAAPQTGHGGAALEATGGWSKSRPLPPRGDGTAGPSPHMPVGMPARPLVSQVPPAPCWVRRMVTERPSRQ